MLCCRTFFFSNRFLYQTRDLDRRAYFRQLKIVLRHFLLFTEVKNFPFTRRRCLEWLATRSFVTFQHNSIVENSILTPERHRPKKLLGVTYFALITLRYKLRSFLTPICIYSVLTRLHELGAEIKYINKTLAPMIWRFTVVDDPEVDVFIVRDADSRLTPRDAAVVADWLRQSPETEAVFHCVRDHPSHTRFPVSGGLWGARRHLLDDHFNGRQV